MYVCVRRVTHDGVMDVRATGGLIGGERRRHPISFSFFTYDRLDDYSTRYISLVDRMHVCVRIAHAQQPHAT